MTYVDGGPPETEADWRRVADTLRQLHRLTPGWPQRPGWRSSTDLLHVKLRALTLTARPALLLGALRGYYGSHSAVRLVDLGAAA